MVHPNLLRGILVVSITTVILLLVTFSQTPSQPAATSRLPLSVTPTLQGDRKTSDRYLPPEPDIDLKLDGKNAIQGEDNLPDRLDFIPDDLNTRNDVFPKPAPPLHLSLDNNKISPDTHLKENLVKPVAYYIWCGKRWFEFKFFLSIVSVIKAMRPDKLLFYYEHYPPVDDNLYNLWIDDLKHDFQFFEMIKMEPDWADVVCRGDKDSRLNHIAHLVGYEGGVYISENAWMLNMPSERLLADVDFALNADMEGYLMLRAGLISGNVTLDDIVNVNDSKYRVLMGSCSAAHHLYKGVKADCIIVKGTNFDNLYPMELVYKENDPFAKPVRELFLGTEAIKKPIPSYDTLVPNIGHMIWVGGGRMDFMFYLSLLSMLFVVKVDVVYIHGDEPPKGHYWEKLNSISRIRERIKLISRVQPSMVYQGPIEPWYRALMSDIIRVDLMIKYGGVYTDTDAIWVKPLSYEERGYDAVATYDWVDWSYPFPDTINFGVSYGKRNAPFYRLFRDSMRQLHNDLHGFTGVSMPYKILEKHPDLIRIDRRLGVICYYSRCHPLWVKDYHNMTHDHVVAKSIPNWKEDVHAFHWTHPNPIELHNETMLSISSGIFAEIGKFVLTEAGLL